MSCEVEERRRQHSGGRKDQGQLDGEEQYASGVSKTLSQQENKQWQGAGAFSGELQSWGQYVALGGAVIYHTLYIWLL